MEAQKATGLHIIKTRVLVTDHVLLHLITVLLLVPPDLMQALMISSQMHELDDFEGRLRQLQRIRDQAAVKATRRIASPDQKAAAPA